MQVLKYSWQNDVVICIGIKENESWKLNECAVGDGAEFEVGLLDGIPNEKRLMS